jgi:outer membrane receptor protein involved in Fe transport
VQILVNGKPSIMMGNNRAAVLEQMPADSIERVEVITNPSAKYRPDGTGGIINLVLKRERRIGHAGSVRVNVGNDERYNAGFTASYNPGDYTLHGRLSLRQDDRSRRGEEERTRFDEAGNVLSSTSRYSDDRSRPFSRVGEIGASYEFGRNTKLEASFGYDDREVKNQASSQINIVRDATGAVVRDYERRRTGPSREHEYELEVNFEHTFGEDRELTGELSFGRGEEDEDELSANISRLAGVPTTTDATQQKNIESELDLSFDYVHPLAAGATLELGYEVEREKNDSDFRASNFDAASDSWIVDPRATNRFIHDSTIHAAYATYGRPIGRFGFLAGLRYEHADIRTDQRTAGIRNRNDYGRLYPSLHLSYRFTDAHQLQLSYSHRVNRPDGDDLNPFPEYDDPFNLSAGNPNLVPEDTHSIEGGYSYENGGTSYLASLYVRQRENGITEVSRYIDANTLLTTPENLATSRSAGLELGATRRIAEKLALNFSANVYRNQINAANLGFASRRTAFAWDAKLNANWEATGRLRLQLATSYSARRLTAQGERHPSLVSNLGMRYDLANKRTSLVLTVSDIFNTMKDRTTIDTPLLKGENTRRRNSQVIYLGFIYNFGAMRRDREEIEFDNTL